MIHLSLTLEVILNSSLQGQRKLLLIFLRCCYYLTIHKDKVSLWLPRRPLAPPFWVSCHCLQAARACRLRGRWMWVVWVLCKDVWNGSMGIKGLVSVGGLLCWRLRPLLASVISPIDTETLLYSQCVFCQPLSHSHFLSVTCTIPFCCFLVALSHSKRISLLFDLTGFMLDVVLLLMVMMTGHYNCGLP